MHVSVPYAFVGLDLLESAQEGILLLLRLHVIVQLDGAEFPAFLSAFFRKWRPNRGAWPLPLQWQKLRRIVCFSPDRLVETGQVSSL